MNPKQNPNPYAPPPMPPGMPGAGYGYNPNPSPAAVQAYRPRAFDAPTQNTPANYSPNLAAGDPVHYSKNPQYLKADPPAQPQTAPQAGAGPAQPTVSKAAATPATNPNSSQNFLEIAEIRDGIAIMNDGSFRSVVMAKSINFDLMSQQEQEAVEFSYQNFLNSLYFPVQIFMRTQRVDLRPYIEKLEKIRTEHDNMLLSLLMEDYIGYIDNLSQQTNIMDKKFYVVIPFSEVENKKESSLDQNKSFFIGLANLFSPKQKTVVINEASLEKAKTELRNRIQSTMSGLQQCGIQTLPLDTQELIELYYDTYNPDTAIHQSLKNYSNLSTNLVTKGEGFAVQPHFKQELEN